MRGTGGRVLAVLSNAVYLRSVKGGIIGISGEDGEDGPFTLRVSDLGLLLRLLKGHENLPFANSEAAIELEAVAWIELGHAEEWQPQSPSAIGIASARVQAVMALVGMLEVNWCSGGTCGLARYLYGSQRSMPLPSEVPLLRTSSVSDTVLRKLAKRVMKFQAAASELDMEGASESLIALLGLGSGLTPSGDDIVAGVLATLVWQQRLGTMPQQFTQGIVEKVLRSATSRTNEISARLLLHAGRGLLYAPAMELGSALLAGDVVRVAGPLRRLLSIGHSSGADLATGLLAGVLAGIEVESRAAIR